MQTKKIIGLKGGKDGCFFEIIAEHGRGKTSYYPSIKNGVRLTFDHPEYWQYKIKRERETVRMIVAGNPICAEDAVKNILGCNCFASGPTSLDIYPEEVINHDN